MNLSELKQELINNILKPIYIFTGEELALQDIYINKIKEISKLQVIRVEYLKDVYSTLKARTLIKREPKIYVIRNDEIYLKDTASWKKIIEQKNLKGNIIILLYSDVETSSKFFKEHDSIAVEFTDINRSILKNRLVAITGMPEQYCEELVNLCDGSYGRLKNELYKLDVLCKVNNYSLNEAYVDAKKYNVIHEEVNDIIFDFSNAVIERNKQLAFNLASKILSKEPPLKLITVLYNSFRNTLIVQSTQPVERTEEILGLTKAQIYVTSQKINRYNTFELVEILKKLRYLEKGIKTGEVDVNYVIDYFLCTSM